VGLNGVRPVARVVTRRAGGGVGVEDVVEHVEEVARSGLVSCARCVRERQGGGVVPCGAERRGAWPTCARVDKAGE